jgi:hypothetical protein
MKLYFAILSAGMFCFINSFADDFSIHVNNHRGYPLEYVKQSDVGNFQIEVTYGRIIFEKGEIWLAGVVDNMPTAALFTGKGRFMYYPPDRIESQQVYRYYKQDTLSYRFHQAYLVGADLKSLLNDLSIESDMVKPSYKIKNHFRRLRNIPNSKFKYNLPLNLAKALADNRGEFLWVVFSKDRLKQTVYFNNPYLEEPISLFKISPEFNNPQLVSSFHTAGFNEEPVYSPGFHLIKYDIKADISTYSKSMILCQMSLIIKNDSMKIVSFGFPADYEVDYVYGKVADSMAFFKKKGHPGLNMILDRYYYRNDTVKIGLSYRTNLFYHYIEYGVVQKNLTHWYPYARYRQLSDYSVEYRIDDGYRFMAVGNRVNDTIAGGKHIYQYKSDLPVAYISFNYGLFDTLAVETGRVPILIYTLPRVHDSPLFGNPNVNRAAEDISGAFSYYDNIFSKYPFNCLNVTAVSTYYGQGSPGVVYLPGSTFIRNRPGLDDKLRAHEVAHQWWGHIVIPETYRDAWISEGFAEYSAAMYIRHAKRGEKRFLDILKTWKKEITQRGRSRGAKSVGFRAGSITLGERLKSELSPGDYINLIYSKAAYMLHMLYFELEVVQHQKGAFTQMLGEFINKFKGRLAGTDDFIEMAGYYLGENTETFFDQWLVNWKVPKIKKKYKIKGDGRVELNLEVSEVDPKFNTSFPVYFYYDNGNYHVEIYRIKYGKNNFVYIPDNAGQVKDVKFNRDHDILEQ